MAKTQEQWYNMFELLLECFVCKDTPKGNIVQCAAGHHICLSCRNQLQVCPKCQQPFIKARSYLAEHMIDYIENIKEHFHRLEESYKNNIPKGITVSTQTDIPSENKDVHSSDDLHEHHAKYDLQTPKIAIGWYFCRIGSCMFKSPYEPLIKHVKSSHRDVFYEFDKNLENGCFTQKWVVNMLPQWYYFGFNIHGMGLFFVNIVIENRDILDSRVVIANSHQVSNGFLYDLQLESLNGGRPTFIRNKKVHSCKLQKYNTVQADSDSLENDTTLPATPFNCTITIKRAV